ncbi:uncharacterized protein LOC131667520 [Phymastichus coffea]|uniref:uncharacterized protein LOC131667520 n=1 Tax=Phymastichus coffea TaxID=108790 RepID=UPI00273B7798|nr:uncharacterized protein LOC131667520 [Phymastichus coffea]XP_058796970.1 uncharacterized protein LOC131667520 [Phymastichus coffea]XP_058796971.1 uncharacterized protein LOC131667520 [Phymastichus coffea]
MPETMEYTTNEELAEIVNKDQNVEIIAFVENLIAPVQVGEKKWWLFKVILSNGSKKIMVLTWGKELIELYQPQLTINKIVHLEKATSKLTNSNFRKDEALIDYELIVGKATSVKFLGIHVNDQPVHVVTRTVSFPDTVGLLGPIRIVGWLKTKFSLITNQNNTAS